MSMPYASIRSRLAEATLALTLGMSAVIHPLQEAYAQWGMPLAAWHATCTPRADRRDYDINVGSMWIHDGTASIMVSPDSSRAELDIPKTKVGPFTLYPGLHLLARKTLQGDTLSILEQYQKGKRHITNRYHSNGDDSTLWYTSAHSDQDSLVTRGPYPLAITELALTDHANQFAKWLDSPTDTLLFYFDGKLQDVTAVEKGDTLEVLIGELGKLANIERVLVYPEDRQPPITTVHLVVKGHSLRVKQRP